ncbi:urokinase plasminogen activator surface receptor-like [Mobula hypostoma]|uniref:urokinase plasminogen activator surface receptor-like n=1 Tax=Mobula hypostoma TaxID=723540 RepID=UPI002FC37719
MKLLQSIFILFALITEALALECYSCSSSDGNCDNQKTYTVTGDEKCMTRTVFSVESGATVPVQYYRGCSTCSQPTSYKNGTHVVVEDCCSDMLCNGQNPRETTLKCYSFTYGEGTIKLKENRCKVGEDRCADMVTLVQAMENYGSLYLFKGCATQQDCKSAGGTNGQIKLNYIVCCDSNLCNNKMTLPGNEGTSITGGGIFLSLLAMLTGKAFY